MKLLTALLLGSALVQQASAACYLGNTLDELHGNIASGAILLQHYIDPMQVELDYTETQLAASTVADVESRLSRDLSINNTEEAIAHFTENYGTIEYIVAPGIFKQTMLVTYLVGDVAYGFIFTIDTGFNRTIETKAVINANEVTCLR